MIRYQPAAKGAAARRVIVCDVRGCSGSNRGQASIATSEADAGAARLEAHKHGWRHGTAPNVDRTIDTCPTCSPRVMEQAMKDPESDREGAETA